MDTEKITAIICLITLVLGFFFVFFPPEQRTSDEVKVESKTIETTYVPDSLTKIARWFNHYWAFLYVDEDGSTRECHVQPSEIELIRTTDPSEYTKVILDVEVRTMDGRILSVDYPKVKIYAPSQSDSSSEGETVIQLLEDQEQCLEKPD